MSITNGTRGFSKNPSKIRQIAKSIPSFGFNDPVLIDDAGHKIAEHGRVLAAIALVMGTVPMVRLHHLSPAQKRAYLVAHNELAELSGWDSHCSRSNSRACLSSTWPSTSQTIYSDFKNLPVWVKANGGLGPVARAPRGNQSQSRRTRSLSPARATRSLSSSVCLAISGEKRSCVSTTAISTNAIAPVSMR